MIRYAAPAKLNLFLHVTGRRPDGYHTLQTVFRLIDLCDWIEVEPRSDGRIERVGELAGVAPEDDLTLKAARTLQAHSGTKLGATIGVEKHIPLGGGLGGGSSDAATVLIALNRLWKLGMTLAELIGISADLGADVPFFLFGRNAWAEGIGDELAEIEVPWAAYLVVNPGISVSTAEIFAAPELTRDTPTVKITSFFTGLGAAEGFRNDLEPVVCQRYPQVAQALHWLSHQSHGKARMSGSGASVFAAFDNGAEARRVADRVPSDWKAFVVHGLDRHPLQSG